MIAEFLASISLKSPKEPDHSRTGYVPPTTEYADIAVDLDGKSLVFVEVSASNSAGIKKPKRVQSRVSNGGRPVGEAQCIGKSAGAEHTAAYQILLHGFLPKYYTPSQHRPSMPD